MTGEEVTATIDHDSMDGFSILAGSVGEIVSENADFITVDYGKAMDGKSRIELSYPVDDFAQYCDDGRQQEAAAAPQQSLRDRARAAAGAQQTNDRGNER